MDPETVHEHFEARVNAGDLGGLIALYEPTAALIDRDKSVFQGTEALRSHLEKRLALKPKLRVQHIQTIRCGSLAVLISRWSLRAATPDGLLVEDHGCACDVARQQPDGTWRVAVDNAYAWRCERAELGTTP